jgi:hypothetical protein
LRNRTEGSSAENIIKGIIQQRCHTNMKTIVYFFTVICPEGKFMDFEGLQSDFPSKPGKTSSSFIISSKVQESGSLVIIFVQSTSDKN